jgi:putative oxidoreductase
MQVSLFNFVGGTMKNFFLLLARIFLVLIFLMAGISKITDFAGSQQYMMAYGMPMAGFLLVVATIIEVVGSLMIIIGYKTKWVALIWVIYLIPTTLIFHTHFSDMVQMVMFWKNLGLMGGLLYVYFFGPGAISIDERPKKQS